MIYNGTGVAEFINVNDRGKHYNIEMAKMPNKSTFVICSDYDDDWGYEFYMENNSDYEKIKFHVMKYVVECNAMYEVLTNLSKLLEDGFADIIVEEEFECECNCENCNCNCNCND